MNCGWSDGEYYGWESPTQGVSDVERTSELAVPARPMDLNTKMALDAAAVAANTDDSHWGVYL